MVDSHAQLPLPAGPPSVGPSGGPCAPARAEVDLRCTDADRLTQAAAAQQQRLREAKRQLSESIRQRDADAQVRDRRQLSEAKEQARRAYHDALGRAGDSVEIQDAASSWLSEIDRLNRQLQLADERAERVAARAAQLAQQMPAIELAADAARIAAEAAQVACMDSRRHLAACEEDAQRRLPTGATPARVAGPYSTNPSVQPDVAPPPQQGSPLQTRGAPISLLLRGDRQALLGLTLHLADETGVEAGRLQLLLLELREGIAARALEDHALVFPADHPFWSQFTAEGGRQVAASLAQLSYHFDGRAGWRDGRSPTVRDLALALAHCGYDPRALRRPAGQAAIDELWQGTGVLVEDYLGSKAPDLSLGRLIDLLGPRATRLGELWDMWGRLRPLLLPRTSAG